jgi:hypothetical protein
MDIPGAYYSYKFAIDTVGPHQVITEEFTIYDETGLIPNKGNFGFQVVMRFFRCDAVSSNMRKTYIYLG